jgi:hypothetical protein
VTAAVLYHPSSLLHPEDRNQAKLERSNSATKLEEVINLKTATTLGLIVLPLVDGAPPIGFWRYTCNEACFATCVH